MPSPEVPDPAPKPFSCLIVEDDVGFASLLVRLVRDLGGEPLHCSTLAKATAASQERAFDLLLLDNHLPDGKVYDFFERLSRGSPDAPAIMITGASDLGEAIQLTRNGLLDYLTKPIDAVTLEASIRRALLRIRKAGLTAPGEPGLGDAPAMREVMEQLRMAARHPAAAVLITGESGTGKDLAVRVLHRLGFGEAAETAPYIAVNCAAIPAEMFEGELFGAERGAYTGADKRRTGLVAAAQNGTLFLDEIAEVPLPLQAKLLRFLENREFRMLGSTETQRFKGRIVAATNKDLHAEVAAGRFREDLLFRIEVLAVALPPLRERRQDIPALSERLLAELAAKYERKIPLLKQEDQDALRQHHFPGNVRELRNILERSLLRTPPESRWLVLDRTWFASRGSAPAATPAPSAASSPAPVISAGGAATPATADLEDSLPAERASLSPLEAQEYRMIRSTLVQTRGAIRRAAARLGLSPQALLRRLEKWPELRPTSPES